MKSNHNPALYWAIIVTAAGTLGLLTLGAFLESAEYGGAIPQWPLIDGGLVPAQLVGGIFYAFVHRMLALAVGVLTLLIGTYIWSREKHPEISRLALFSIGLIMAQILIGGLAVLMDFPFWLELPHAFLAPVFFAMLVALATVHSADWQERAGGVVRFDEKTIRRTRALGVMLLLQIFFGAALRHTDVGSIYMISLLLHLLLAIGVTIAGITTPIAVLRQAISRPTKLAGALLAGLVVVQFLLGIAVFVAKPGIDPHQGQPPIAYVGESVVHVGLGAVLLGLAVYLALMVRRKTALAPPQV